MATCVLDGSQSQAGVIVQSLSGSILALPPGSETMKHLSFTKIQMEGVRS